MLDFTSSLYLGFGHPSRALRPWDRLTTGTPAALAESPEAAEIGRALAGLPGCDAGTVATSTLHLFWDLFPILTQDGRVAIHVDAGTYPIARWGVERAGCRGAVVRTFAHHDPDGLARGIRRVPGRVTPLVVTDGYCPACGRAAPLREYLEIARRFGGRVVVDDTQALGVLGAEPGSQTPYGRGGGGTPRWCGVSGPELIVAASLAKGFGAPLALLAGPADVIGLFEAQSETRVHSSPPAAAALRAAEHALVLNHLRGEERRLRLARLVGRFRAGLADAGVRVSEGLFPIQTLAPARGVDPFLLHRALVARGLRAVLHRLRPGGRARLTFLITACHRMSDIDVAVEALRDAMTRPPSQLARTG